MCIDKNTQVKTKSLEETKRRNGIRLAQRPLGLGRDQLDQLAAFFFVEREGAYGAHSTAVPLSICDTD